jgi:hypothetical protein
MQEIGLHQQNHNKVNAKKESYYTKSRLGFFVFLGYFAVE